MTLRTVQGPDGEIHGLGFSPDGRTLASGSASGTIRLWDTETGQARGLLQGHSGPVFGVAFSPLGRMLASVGFDGAVKFWESEVERQSTTYLEHADAVKKLAYAPDGRTVATGDAAGTVSTWEAATGKRRLSFPAHVGGINSLAFAPHGQLFATAGNWDVKLWDAESGKQRGAPLQHRGEVRAVKFSPDGKTLVSAGGDRTVRLWDLDASRERAALGEHDCTVSSLDFSSDGRLLCSADERGELKIWDVALRQELMSWSGHDGTVEAVAFSPGGKSLASTGADRSIRLWDPSTGRGRTVLGSHSGRVNSLAFTADGRTIATCSADHQIKLWDVATGRELNSLTGHAGAVNGLTFSPDGSRLASAGDDRIVISWDIARVATAALENPLARSLANPSHRDAREELALRTKATRMILDKLEEQISINFNEETPLDDILKYIKVATTSETYAGIPIYVDPTGLQEAERTLNSTVEIDLRRAPLKKTLTLLLGQLDLTFRVADGRLTITSLDSGDQMFGATLHAPRQSPNLASPILKRNLEKLEQPISMAFPNETPLDDVLKYIEQATTSRDDVGIVIHVDPIGLQEVEKSLTSTIIYDHEGVPLRQSLKEILGQLDLTYVIEDEFLIITSKESVSSAHLNERIEARRTASMLDERVDLKFDEPTPLGDVIAFIVAATTGPRDRGLLIDFDWPEAIDFETHNKQRKKLNSIAITYRSNGAPLRESLKELLGKVGLGYEESEGSVWVFEIGANKPERKKSAPSSPPRPLKK